MGKENLSAIMSALFLSILTFRLLRKKLFLILRDILVISDLSTSNDERIIRFVIEKYILF